MISTASNKGGLIDLTIIRGVSLTWPFTLKKNGVAINLTGAVFTAQIVENNQTKSLLATMTVNITNAVAGEAFISMTPIQTTALVERKAMEWRCSYQIGSEVKHVFYGSVKALNGTGS